MPHDGTVSWFTRLFLEDLLGCPVDLVTEKALRPELCPYIEHAFRSMSDASQSEWHFYLDDMIDFAGKVLASTDGSDQTGFVASGLTYGATLRNLELIGEAAPIFRAKPAQPIRKSPG